MPRAIVLVAFAYVSLCLAAVAAARRQISFDGHAPVNPYLAEAPDSDAAVWFQTIKPYCNAVEVEVTMRRSGPPGGELGTAYQAACYALAGRIDQARGAIESLDGDARWRAAGVVFEVGHPVADAGDDRAAGPIMALVADYWPNHFMALYHAGMSEYATGDLATARRHLAAFLELYPTADGWRSNAATVLGRLGR